MSRNSLRESTNHSAALTKASLPYIAAQGEALGTLGDKAQKGYYVEKQNQQADRAQYRRCQRQHDQAGPPETRKQQGEPEYQKEQQQRCRTEQPPQQPGDRHSVSITPVSIYAAQLPVFTAFQYFVFSLPMKLVERQFRKDETQVSKDKHCGTR